ncbi:hypothetical protein EDM56_26415 [Brevibacillus fluminis]|uniref:TolC family protein n=1 Tax=Brevibacillus fluminis TaxID=511487 RepID=A0A3M8CZL6_9BACL|nr:TolC family protein [Brevibacillus fluminis]RNB81250.1 hypothetical protein EDM56_26415 [Brevibacillus fluminis]
MTIRVKFPWIVSFISLVSFSFSTAVPSIAAETTQPQQNAEILTIEKAIKLVNAADSEVALASLDAENDDVNARIVKSQLRNIGADSIDSLEFAEQKYVTEAQSAMDARISKLYKESVEADLRGKAILSYYDLLQAYSERESKKRRYNRVNELVQMAKENATSSKNTTVSNVDVMQAEAIASIAKVEWFEAQSTWGETKIKQNEILGVDAQKEWLFPTEDEVTTEDPPISFEDAIASLQTDSFAIAQTKGDMEIAQLRVALINKYSAVSTFYGKIATNNLEKLKVELEHSKKEDVYAVYTLYQKYRDGYQLLQTCKHAVKLASENYDQRISRFKQGTASIGDVLQSEQELAKLEDHYVAARNDFNHIRANFQ